MSSRLPVLKTWKLFIGGQFPRSESGRSLHVHDAGGEVIGEICHASRKDLRDAVEAARAARDAWAGRTAYNRGQILYRMAEMLEARREEFTALLRQSARLPAAKAAAAARREVDASIDRLVCFAGWADKFAQVLGCQNPVAGPYYNFTVPDPTGVIVAFTPQEPALLGFVTLFAPALTSGNTVVLIAPERAAVCAAVYGEVCATSDVPAGVLNVLTGRHAELAEPAASHRDIDAIVAAGVTAEIAATLRGGAAENVKRVTILTHKGEEWYDESACESPWTIEPFVEMKTIWHPAAP